jgi:uncharacterized delta-60 repeat protein
MLSRKRRFHFPLLLVTLITTPLLAFFNGGKLPLFEGAEDTVFFSSNGRDGSQATNGFDGTVYAVMYHTATNSLIVGGAFTQYNGVPVPRLAKLSLDGQLDTTFVANLGAGFVGPSNLGTIYALAQDSVGRILVGGYFEDAGGNSSLDYIARLNDDGTYDSNFAPEPLVGNIKSIAVDGSDNLVIGCNCQDTGTSTYNLLMRLRAFDGKIDSTFSQSVLTYNGTYEVRGVGILGDGSIVAVGNFVVTDTTNRNHIMKFTSTGAVDATFYANEGSGFNNVANTVLVQPDQKILVGGGFISYNGTTTARLARLNSDGTRDTGFSTSFLPAIGQVHSLVLDSNASPKIFVGGFNMGTFSGSAGFELSRRYTSAGVKDGTYNTGSGLAPTGAGGARSYAMAFHKGYLYVGGDFTTYNGKNVPRIIKIYVGPYTP